MVTCPACEHEWTDDYERFDTEATSIADHGVCWYCHWQIKNGELCRDCWQSLYDNHECEV